MKITYPECQIEISVDEVIALIDHANLTDAGTQLVQEIEKIKVELPPIDPEILRKGFGDEDPEPHPEPEPEPEPKPKQRSTRLKKPKKAMAPKDNEPDEQPKRKNKTNSKAVQVLLENGWKTFGSVSQAAEAIGSRLNHLSHALLNNKTCNGYQVRYAVDSKEQTENTNEEPTELP